MGAIPAEWRDRVDDWLAHDPDPGTRAELEALVAAGRTEAIDDRFGAALRFGTAGLRGALGAGPNRMNRVVVRQAAEGILRHLADTGASAPTVVIGYDARRNSDVFAADTAALVAAHGGRAVLFEGPVPTPVLAFSVRELGADAGVMVTASHNPPADNGYKVYMADGAQIVSPTDTHIEAQIDGVGLPPLDLPEPAPGGRVDTAGDGLVASYIDTIVAAVPRPSGQPPEIVYTPLHGVGRDVLVRAFEHAGLGAPTVVPEQAAPDGTFPTVAFPNPEEAGAMDLALGLATARAADLVIANDPDADRLAVAIPDNEGGWRLLSGNEIGVLLGDRLLRASDGADRIVVNSIVSSRQLGVLATRAGVQHRESLTGFKWITRVGYADPDLRFIFGYEEALGYACTTAVRDKDGISATLVFAELVQGLAAAGRSVAHRLDEIAVETGVHQSDQVTVRFDDVAGATDLVGVVRAHPPTAIGPLLVERFVDFAAGIEGWPHTDMLMFDLEGGARLLVRPSGTEPKLKAYLEVVRPVPDATALPTARRQAETDLAAFRTAVESLLSVP